MEHEAIYKLYPNVKNIETNEDGLITTAYDDNKKIISIDMSAVNTKIIELQTAKNNAETNAATKKASGKQKLLDLGLSEEEVKALIGV